MPMQIHWLRVSADTDYQSITWVKLIILTLSERQGVFVLMTHA